MDAVADTGDTLIRNLHQKIENMPAVPANILAKFTEFGCKPSDI